MTSSQRDKISVEDELLRLFSNISVKDELSHLFSRSVAARITDGAMSYVEPSFEDIANVRSEYDFDAKRTTTP